MYNAKLDYLYFELEMAEQDLHDHDGSELDAEDRIKKLKKQIKEIEDGTN